MEIKTYIIRVTHIPTGDRYWQGRNQTIETATHHATYTKANKLAVKLRKVYGPAWLFDVCLVESKITAEALN